MTLHNHTVYAVCQCRLDGALQPRGNSKELAQHAHHALLRGDTQRALLSAMGIACENEAAAQASLRQLDEAEWRRLLSEAAFQVLRRQVVRPTRTTRASAITSNVTGRRKCEVWSIGLIGL